MRVALVSMPWCDFGTPSAALGALSAYIRVHLPHVGLSCHSEHLEIYRRLGADTYRIFRNNRVLGEDLYLSTLFPAYKSAVKKAFIVRADAEESKPPAERSWGGIFNDVRETLIDHRDGLAERLAGDADVVGITTSLAQTFSSLSLACRIKDLSPAVHVVLGGAAVDGMMGRAILQEFPFIDYIVEGEGELPFAALLKALEEGRAISREVPGVVARENARDPVPPKKNREVPDLDSLPFPDYDEYAEKAEELSIIWSIPVEGSRGCWWDRTVRTGNPRNRCLFCSYGGVVYRDKSARRVAREVGVLARRYENVRIAFCENAVRPRGIPELAAALKRQPGEFLIFTGLRANTSARDILSLYEAGMMRCECGIEGFSNAYLRRINKGTTVIRNLEVLRTCHELGIHNNTNLIVGFPGATSAEVEETAATIRDYACTYYPPGRTIRFQLVPGSAVDILRDEYGIGDVENIPDYRAGLPPETGRRLLLAERTFEAPEQADWGPVEEACVRWAELHETLKKDDRFPAAHPLYYHDGGNYLEVVDRRDGSRTVTLPGPWHDIYLFCMEIRTERQIEERFAGSTPSCAEMLEWLVAEKLVYKEGRLYLSLAVALTPGHAIRRMKKRGKLLP